VYGGGDSRISGGGGDGGIDGGGGDDYDQNLKL
jgi:hypothetical protein